MKSVSSQINSLDSIFPWVRERAMNNLVEIGVPAVKEIVAALDTRYAPVILDRLDSSQDSFSEPLRIAKRIPRLLDVLVKIGKPAIPELEEALYHPNMNVRLLAMETIERIGYPSIVDLFFPFLKSKEYYERGLAVGFLGKTHSPKVLEQIVAALDDESSYVRNIAIIALGNIGDMSVLPKLEQLKSDKTLVDDYGRKTMGDMAQEAIDKILERENK
jgi:HEAT repeat protein